LFLTPRIFTTRGIKKIIITAVTEEPRESMFLFQRCSIALQRRNVVAFQGMLKTE